MLRSDLVATFVSIADTGSLSAAARQLGVARSVVSERLAALEAELGGLLVSRSSHGLSLTPSGETFLERARDILSAMEAARDEFSSAEGAITGRIRIAVPHALGTRWLAPVFVDFLRDFPGVSLEVSASDQTVDVIQDGFDLAVRSARLADSDLIARRLATGRRMLVCSPSYADTNGVPASLQELRDHVAIVYRNRRASQDWTFATENGVTSARVRGRLHIDDGSMMCAACVAGLGVALLPTFIVADALLEGRLRPVDIGVRPETDAIAVVYPRAHRQMPRIGALVDAMQSALGDPPPWDRALADAGLAGPG